MLALSAERLQREQEEFLLTYEDMAEIIECVEGLSDYQPQKVLLISDSYAFYQESEKLGMAFLQYLGDADTADFFPKAAYAVTSLKGVEYTYLKRVYERFHQLPWHILDTPQLRVREMMVEDLEALYEIYSHPTTTLYMEGLYEDKEKEASYMKDYIRNVYGFYGYGLWIVEEKTSERIVGRAGLSHREGYEEPELGYVIGRKYQNKGYATQVCRAILDYGKSELGFAHFNAFVHKDNTASIRICEKCGMHRIEQALIGDELLERYYM